MRKWQLTHVFKSKRQAIYDNWHCILDQCRAAIYAQNQYLKQLSGMHKQY